MPDETQIAKRPRTPSENSIAVLDSASFDQMYRIANAMAAAALIPDHLKFRGEDNRDKNGPINEKRTAANCFLVVNQAVRWDMCPFSIMGGSYVVGGKLAWEGKVIAAVVNAKAGLQERLSYDYQGTGDARTVTVSGIFKGESSPRELKGSVKDWKTENPMWKKPGLYQDQKLAYSGVIWWARRYAPELVLGVIMEDERPLEMQPGEYSVASVDTAPSEPPPRPRRSAAPAAQTLLAEEIAAPDEPVPTVDDLGDILMVNKISMQALADEMTPPLSIDVKRPSDVPAERRGEAIQVARRLAAA